MKLRLCFSLLVFALTPVLCQAWSGAGHMVIAAEAYEELPADVKAKANELLKSHPDFAKWESAYQNGPRNVDHDLYIFMRASTWPDEIRRKGKSEEAHAHWHYVDYPLKGSKFALESRPAPKDDVVFGIEQSEKTLSKTHKPTGDRAVALAWLIHLVGDLHQPLHCSSLVNATYPKGDKGGNDFYVAPGAKGIKLHSLWDGLLGTRNQPQIHLNDAIRITRAHPRNSLPELDQKKPKAWSLEGRQLAVDKAYLHGGLKGSKTPAGAPPLPNGYTADAKLIAERQAALAGYRLADDIETCLGSTHASLWDKIFKGRY
jgi:hypothetical protein